MRPFSKPVYELGTAVVVLIIGLILRSFHIDTVVDAVIFLASGYLFRGGVDRTGRKQ